MAFRSLASLLVFTQVAFSQQCTLQFEGRVPAGSTPDYFDQSTSLYSPDYVIGQDLAWSDIIQLPKDIPSSLFDGDNSIPVEVTISDESIFAPSADNVQTGFRRAELQPISNNGSDPSTTGIKALHFSIRKDNERPLNVSHEYQLVFLESADYSTNQFVLKTGTLLDVATPDPDSLMVMGNVQSSNELFSTEFAPDVWHNFGLLLDFEGSTTQVFYSTDSEPLAEVTDVLQNDLSGQGQYHLGILKKPTGDNLGDITKEGYQPSGIDEGIIFGGIFQEDSAEGCISLSP